MTELFGPRQGALIDAVTERLRNGFAPMNEHDVAVLSWVAGVLGLPQLSKLTVSSSPLALEPPSAGPC